MRTLQDLPPNSKPPFMAGQGLGLSVPNALFAALPQSPVLGNVPSRGAGGTAAACTYGLERGPAFAWTETVPCPLGFPTGVPSSGGHTEIIHFLPS